MNVVGIDTGTTQTGYAVLPEDMSCLIEFGKVDNENMLTILERFNSQDTYIVFEKFAPGSTIGSTLIDSIVWYGRFVQKCEELHLPYAQIYRRVIKKHFLGKIDKSKGSADSQMRRALIERFAKFDFKNGKGTKDNHDFFWGCASTDVYAAICAAVCWIDMVNEK